MRRHRLRRGDVLGRLFSQPLARQARMLLPQCSEIAVEVEALKLERPIPLDEQQAETARKRRLRTEETAANFEANVCKGAVVVPPTRIDANPAQLPDIDERLTDIRDRDRQHTRIRDQQQRFGGSGSTEPLSEAPPCLLKAEATVESVCIASAFSRRQENETATTPTCLFLDRIDERLADPTPTVTLVDGYRTELRRGIVVFERKADVDACQPNNFSVQLGNDKTIRCARPKSLQSLPESFRGRRVTKLSKEPR
jgi:hypothetical protein